MDAWSSEQNGFAGTPQTAGTSATVATPQYFTLLVSDPYANPVPLQGVHPTYVPFVQDSANQAFYATTNVSISYPQHMVGEPGSIYTTQYGQYYPENTTAAMYDKMVSDILQETTADQLLPQDNSAYLIQQDVGQDTAHEFIGAQSANPQTEKADADVLPGNTTDGLSSVYGDEHGELSHTTFASPITVLWLAQNYEAAEGKALAFSTAYKHYLIHCKENKLNPVTQSLYGKLFRSVFLGLQTRRIGTRYNTNYYYYGIRVIPGSALNNVSEDATSAVHQQTSSEESNTILPDSDCCGSGTQNTENQYEQNIYHSAISDHSYSSAQYPHQHQSLGQSEAMSEFPDLTFPLGFDLPDDYVFGV
jgi:hypothetical protein